MRIDFYEEFPEEQNLEKAKLIPFPSTVFLASKDLAEFKKRQRRLRSINPQIESAYWPIVDNSYWISPFANPSDLKKLFRRLNKIKNDILIDLELPLKKGLIRKNLLNYFKNKREIKTFLEKNKTRIITAEHSHLNFLTLRLLGLDYPVETRKTLMWYSSMVSEDLNREIKAKLKNLSRDLIISVGTIAPGIHGNEPILEPDQLKKDLNYLKRLGYKHVIIFRLGGLNKEYIKIIKPFATINENTINKNQS